MNYFKDIYDEIYEDFLDENIPRDLFNVYLTEPYESQRNPETKHQELHSKSRRNRLYDYGKAQYKVITPEEAIQMVKNNKQEVQNLRIIFNSSLVEYEVRDNGNIYAIYRSSYPVTIGDKTFKNIGYAPWKAVLYAADKIYWTDEYERKLSPEEINKRAEKQTKRTIYKGIRPGDKGYNPHAPYDNLVQGDTITTAAVPDTGAHLGRDRYHIEYTLARKALRNLEANKELYDDDEYNKLKTNFENIKKDRLAAYNQFKEMELVDKTKNIKEIPLEVDIFQRKILEYTKAIQTALSRSYELKKAADKLLITTANTELDWRLTPHLNRIRPEIKALITQLTNDNETIQKAEAASNKEYAEREIKRLLDDIISFKSAAVNRHLNELEKIENEMRDIQEIFAKYRPGTTAKKARNLAANTKEISADVLNVIEFTNF